MAKTKGANPLDGGSHYEQLLGVDRGKIHEKIRKKEEESDRHDLLSSNDLFGDIIGDLDDATPHVSSPPAVPTAETDPRPSEGRPAFEPNGVVTDPVASGDAYSTLLRDSQLKAEVERLKSLRSARRKELSSQDTEYGQYVLLEKIASGGMAEVFRAKRKGVEGFEKIVAVKRILPHLSDNHEFIDMFVAEAKMVAGLTHPNIAQIFDLGVIDDSYYIAMEYVKGFDLRTVLTALRSRKAALADELAAMVAANVASALEYAHRHRDESGRELHIVHRDVSPQNILISLEGNTKLVDFGIAKAAIKATHTDVGSLRGKLLYMAPEQARGQAIDNRADVFSLGSVLFEMLAGEALFSASSEISIMEQVRQARVRLPSELRAHVAPELDRVVEKALRADPKDRYQDACEMLVDLDRFLTSRPVTGSNELSRFVCELFEVDPAERSSTGAGATKK